ncbi:uncharacterized protein JN550_003097 [Neoarthrinium moseri]|uniref:uncharacterized protein n=1 Tax=Neoarthrinium moseri TaxID=1658444 RepID=UPI001FDE2A7D|nr:uncharacterized protein JN550_003097 [Neoarthrinium moseri]KAI1873828.1 hypothetical protein JN550_003097 [Neoarthrinium moseri]
MPADFTYSQIAPASSESTAAEKEAHDANCAKEAEAPEASPRDVHGWKLAISYMDLLSFILLYAFDCTVVADVQTSIINDFGAIDQLSWLSNVSAINYILAPPHQVACYPENTAKPPLLNRCPGFGDKHGKARAALATLRGELALPRVVGVRGRGYEWEEAEPRKGLPPLGRAPMSSRPADALTPDVQSRDGSTAPQSMCCSKLLSGGLGVSDPEKAERKLGWETEPTHLSHAVFGRRTSGFTLCDAELYKLRTKLAGISCLREARG